jgi:hypothetical protein
VTGTLSLLLVLQAWSTSQGGITSEGRYTAPSNPSGEARVIFRHNGFADTGVVRFASSGGTLAGIPFGPYGSWSGTDVIAGAPFTAGMGTTSEEYVVGLLGNLTTKAILNPFGGGSDLYLTGTSFDLVKWRAKLARYTATHRSAILSAYQSGKLLGLVVLDEPHNVKWGGGLTKTTVDGMCAELKAAFPGVPAGVTHQHDLFFPATDYRVCDFLVDQYVWRKASALAGGYTPFVPYKAGEVANYRDDAVAWANRSGVALVMSMNILNGSFQAPRDGLWNCPSTTGGRGTDEPNCRMTAAQVREYGLALGPIGCALLMWRWDDAFMARTDNRAAFADVASALASLPRKACVRS